MHQESIPVAPVRRFGADVVLRVFLLLVAALITGVAHADFSFVHITDTHFGATDGPGSNAEIDGTLFREIATLPQRPAFAVHTGDVCESATPAEYAIYRKTSERLKPVRQYVVPGNHDVRWNPLGKEGYTKGTNQPLYQSWDYQQVHFILLDSTVLLQHWGHFDRAMRDWLTNDLKKTGPTRPVIIGFHHFVGRPGSPQVDNADEFARLISPYNVRLLLIGHGHSDLLWNVNGVPAIMAKGLYQGSYHLIQVKGNTLTVYRRTTETKSPTVEVLSESLAPQQAPTRTLEASVKLGEGEVTLSGNFPRGSTATFRFDNEANNPLTLISADQNVQPSVWKGKFLLTAAYAGEHQVTATVTLPDKRVYDTTARLTLAGDGFVRPLWRVQIGGEVQGKIVRSGNLVLVPSMRGELFALDAATGKGIWRVQTGGAVFSTPYVSNGVVYFGSADHKVYAADLKTGRVLWRRETGGAVFAGAARAGDVVCIASTDTNIYGLSAKDGKPLWTVKGENMFQSQAATDGERFFVGGWDNAFRCIDAKTGKEIWTQKFGKNAKGDFSFYYAPAIASPTLGDGRVYVSSNDGVLHAVNITEGTVAWEVKGPALGYSSPLFRDGRVYNGSLTDRGRVFAFNASDGSKVWETETGSVIYDSSCVYGAGNIYIGCVDATLSALRAQDGAVQWQYRLAPGHVLGSPAADDQMVIIGSLNGEVTALPVTPLAPAPAETVPVPSKPAG